MPTFGAPVCRRESVHEWPAEPEGLSDFVIAGVATRSWSKAGKGIWAGNTKSRQCERFHCPCRSQIGTRS